MFDLKLKFVALKYFEIFWKNTQVSIQLKILKLNLFINRISKSLNLNSNVNHIKNFNFFIKNIWIHSVFH